MSNLTLNRREMLKLAAVPVAAAAAAQGAVLRTSVGVGAASYALRARASGGFRNAETFVEHCREIGAGGIQVPLAWLEATGPGRVREASRGLDEMWVEMAVDLPRDQADLGDFQSQLREARNCGAEVVRASLLNGLRWEMHKDEEAVEVCARQVWKSLVMAEPMLRKRRIRLAIENSGDLRLEELVSYVRKLSSEFVGLCLDPANGLPLLESPMEVVEELAPYTYSVHLKDLAVVESESGLEFVETALGDGVLDLPGMIRRIRQARPNVRFTLDLAHRKPLEVPFLREHYWNTLQKLPGWRVAGTLAWVRDNRWEGDLPILPGQTVDQRLESEHDAVRRSLAYARETLEL